jgi:hypothetical protein
MKGTAIPIHIWRGTEGTSGLKLTEILDNQHMKVERLSALRTGRLYLQEDLPITHFCYTLSRCQGQSCNTVIPIYLRIYEYIIITGAKKLTA